MKSSKLISIVFGLGVVFNSQAGVVNSTDVVSIQSYTTGTVGIITNNQSVNPATCASTIKYLIPSTDNGVNSVLSVFLTAKASGKPVKIYIHDSLCSSGYPLITSVVLL